jgi:spore coat polysaccharide biosynthesis protein SpsF (cytidylyltransferase family)
MEKRNNLAVLQARMSSNRLPGKVLMEVNGKPMIYWQIQRILQSKEISKLVVATSDCPTDDVLARFIKVENIYNPDSIIRLTGDCPLVMPELIDSMIKKFYKVKVEYLSNIIELTYPDGLDIEIIKAGTLSKLTAMNLLNNEREHVTLGIINRLDQFSSFNVANLSDLSSYRWTVDTEDDLVFVRGVFKAFTSRETEFNFEELVHYFKVHPHLNRLKVR